MTIQITEYSYSSVNGEFVEFTNTGTSTVDMTGWSFDDSSRIAGSFSLSSFGSVKAGESVIITESDATAFRTAWGLSSTTVKILGGSALAKVTNGVTATSDQALQRADELNLYDNNGALIDRLTYDDATIAGSPRTQNVSAYTDPANLGKNDASKWKLSTVGDIQGGKTSVTGGDIGSPGSTLAGIDLSRYTRVGRYDLPEITNINGSITAAQKAAATASGSLLAQEVSAVTYDWDTDTLFVVGDGGTSVVQVDKTGKLIDSMTLAAGNSPQGTEFFDPEGLAYIGNGKFVMTEERDRQIVQFTYAPNTTLTRTTAGTSTVKLGTTVGNIGLEGITYDPSSNSYVIVKEISPEGIFQTTIDFVNKTASNGSPTTENSVNLFDPLKLSLGDLADVYALSNVTALSGKADASHLLVLSQESGKILNVDRSGNVFSSLTISALPRNPNNPLDILDVAAQSHEGVTVDKNGILYVISENGGGNFNRPELWVYAPTAASVPLVNQAPTAVLLNNSINSIADKTSTATRFKLSDIAITDDGLGINNLTLTGADASFFEIFENALYIKAGTTIDFKTKSSYNVSVNVDDPAVGTNPDAFKAFSLSIADPNPVTNTGGLFITEVSPWSSGNSPVAADWFELTNTSKNAINITGWKFDDNSNSFASSVPLAGITSIGAGESVVFVETTTVAGAVDAFKNNWFGSNVPAGFKIGSYAGGGVGLSTGGDAVNIYNAAGTLQANVTFDISPSASPFATFNNAALKNNATIADLSAIGVNGAFSIIDSRGTTEIGSPGSIGISAPFLSISEVAPWASGNSPYGADWFEVTNTGTTAVDITGWKIDDNSNSFAAAVTLNGVTSIAAGQSVVFIESTTPSTTIAAFKTAWFGDNVPAGFTIGSYSGSGVGLSTAGDAVNLFDASGKLVTRIDFGASTTGLSFDNSNGLASPIVSALSKVGTNGTFLAADGIETGSPGSITSLIFSGSVDADTLNGSSGNDTIFGLAGNDTINGGAGNDTIYGGIGVDFLFGGAGADVFGFNNANEGFDKINDFVVGEDKIAISRDGFGGDSTFGISSLIGGALDSSRFTLGSSATLNSHRFIYNANSGVLSFDKDGAGGEAQVRIAQLVGIPALTSTSFSMV
jgi:uncharacterized protein YjiK